MRRILPILLLAVPLLFLAAAPQDAPQKKGGGGAPKNLKVLKPEEVRPVMGAMHNALGVQCDFCHVQDRSSDENPKKLVARHMMEMVNQINANFPDGKVHVTCYTCHRGATMPLTVPPPAAGGL